MGADGEPEPTAALVNGRPIRVLDVEDRGLAYGDGLFETIAVRAGRPCLWPEHRERLRIGCDRLGLPRPPEALLRDEIRRLVVGCEAATLKLILTRGRGPRGYRPPDPPRPSRILLRYSPSIVPDTWPPPAVTVKLCATRLGISPVLAGIKHLNRLEQVLARSEWDDPHIAEGLMCDGAGALVCGTTTNLFLLRDGAIVTPLLDRAGVAGTVRSRLMREAGTRGAALREMRLHPEDLVHADGAFLTNALIGCRPIQRVDDQDLDPSAVPSDLLAAVQRAVVEPAPDW